jgi:hypothetical protein
MGRWRSAKPSTFGFAARPFDGSQYFWIPSHCGSEYRSPAAKPSQLALNLCELVVGQVDLRRRRAFREMSGGTGAGDRQDMRRFGERPGDG